MATKKYLDYLGLQLYDTNIKSYLEFNYLALAGGTLSGILNSRSIVPAVNDSYNLGTSEYAYNAIYGTNIYENGILLESKYAQIVKAVKYAGDQQSIGADSPASGAKDWVTASNLPNGNALVYNSAGAEYSLLYAFRTDNIINGTILKWGYSDKYMRILRRMGGTWQSDDWEKISAGYADNAGQLDGRQPSYYLNYENFNNVPDVIKKQEDIYTYPYIGTGHVRSNTGGQAFKITLPYAGITSSSNEWFMNTFELVIGQSYVANSVCKLYFSYYALKGASNTWSVPNCQVFGVGSNLSNISNIYYVTNNPAIIYITFTNNNYITMSINNLTANDTANSYDFRNTTLELADLPDTSTLTNISLTYVSANVNTQEIDVNKKLTVKAPIVAYEYINHSNQAALIMDKPGSNYTGIGSHNIADTIWFGACTGNGVWIDSYKQIWQFNGNVKADSLYENGTLLENKYAPKSITSDESIEIVDSKLIKISARDDDLALPNKSLTDIVEAEGNTIAYNQQRNTVSGDINKTCVIWETLAVDEDYCKCIIGHKYYVCFNFRFYSDNTIDTIVFKLGHPAYGQFVTNAIVNGFNSHIGELVNTEYTAENSFFQVYAAGLAHFSYSDLRIFDLTQAFGSGNEPTSVNDAKITWLLKYANEHPEFNAGQLIDSFGKLINFNRNIWNEQWEHGSINSLGEKIDSSGYRSKDYIPALPEILYFPTVEGSSGTSLVIYFYDDNYNMIPYTGAYAYQNGYNGPNAFTTPARTKWLLFRTSGLGDTYSNGICINVADPSFDGTYIPHVESKQQLSKLKSAGNAHDSQVDNKITRRIKSADLSTLNWTKVDYGGIAYYYANVSDIKRATNDTIICNIICSNYITNNISQTIQSQSISYICSDDTNSRLLVSATPLGNNTPTGIVNYELAEPTTEDALPIVPMATYYAGYEMQDSPVPYTLTRKYNISIYDDTQVNVDTTKSQQDVFNYILNSYLLKTETAADSNKLGGQLPSYYTNTANIIDDNLGDTLDVIISAMDTAIGNKLDKSGGTLTGNLTTRNLIPDTNGSRNIGSTTNAYYDIYAYRVGLGKSADTNGEIYFYNESHDKIATISSNPGQATNILATLPKTSGTLLTSTQMGEIIVDDDGSPVVRVVFSVAPTEGDYLVVPDNNYANYWQGTIAHLSSNKGSFRMAKSIGSSSGSAYVAFTYSGTTVTNTSADAAADYGHFYIYKIR